MHRVESGDVVTAPGQDWSYVFSQIEHVRINSLSMILTTDATADNRIIAIGIKDRGGNSVYLAGVGTAIPASSSGLLVASSAFGNLDAGGVNGYASAQALPFPRMWLPPGWSIYSTTALLQPGDTWSNVKWAAEFSPSPFVMAEHLNMLTD